MRRFRVIVAGALLAGPAAVAAQGPDPDKAVSGAGIQVKGWTGRVDRPTQKLEDVKFVEMGGGFHITGGPHAIFWSPANVATGDYTVKATLTKTPASRSEHAESYGVFIGGTKLDTPDQNYLYCVVFGNGTFSVIHRYGGETHQLVSRQAHAAVSKAGDGKPAKDEIALWVRGGKVGCTINGQEVASWPKADMLGPGKLESTDGLFGLRASHNLDLHVAGFGVTKG